jgi:HD superfamily phosphohydrolase
LLQSIVDSVIDVDKVDYLQRDSIHCGVTYGQAIDEDRLISSLTVNPQTSRICLTEKGRSCFVGLLTSNIIMYREVYWHKTVRACSAMFKRFFYQFMKESKDSFNSIKENILSYTDEKFIEALSSEAENKPELKKLISPFLNQGRALYKPAFVYFPTYETSDPSGATKKFFEAIAKASYSHRIGISEKVVDTLRERIDETSNMENLDILLETAPVDYREVADLNGFKFYDPKMKEFEGLTTAMEQLNEYLKENRSYYILCEPSFYSTLKKLTLKDWSEIFIAVNKKL